MSFLIPEPTTVRSDDTTIEITCSLPTGALTANDVMFATQEIALAGRVEGQTIILQSIHVLDEADQGAAFDLIFLSSDTSIGTEDAEVSITDANARNILTSVSVTADDYIDLIGCQSASIGGIGKSITLGSATTSLWVAGVTRGTPTYSASGVRIRFSFLR